MAEKEYIERDAFYDFCKDQIEEETGAYSKGRNAGLRVAMSAAMNKDAIPAADVRPVVRGEWRKIGKIGCIFFCSACDKTFPCKTDFCPNCGADMREES